MTEAHELPPWCPPKKTHSHSLPPGRPHEDLRWRREPGRAVESVGEPQDRREQTWQAMAGQISNARIPGYTGFVPSARAEDVYGRTHAATSRVAMREQFRSRERRERAPEPRPTPPPDEFEPLKTDPDAGKVHVTRNHWVPTVPGYGGFMPAKDAENICGGGITASCRMAGRAIAERQPFGESPAILTSHDGAERSRIADFYHSQNRGKLSDEARLGEQYRGHCSRQIPGYTGHVPRVAGESIYGSTARAANLLAADLCEDRLANPSDHFRDACAPQFPQPRKLRM